MQRLYSVGGALGVSAALMLGQCNPAPPKPPAAAVASAVTGHKATTAMTLANQERRAAGLPALRTGAALHRAALGHSIDQARRNSMGHTGSDGSNAGQRILRNGGSYSTWAENVAAGYRSASSVINAWMNSPGHRKNILNPKMTRMNIAVAYAADGTKYWTMVLKAD